jgi:hypothetical protein
MLVHFFNGHFAVIDRLEFNFGRLTNGMPDDIVGTSVLEPAAICIMPTQVRVERIIHGRNITSARHFAGSYELP